MKRWTVADVMTHDVVCVGEETGYREILGVLAERRISAVPVIDESGRIVGVVTEADLLHKVEIGEERRLFERSRRRAARAKSHADRARELMTAPAVTARADATLAEVASLLEAKGIKRLPVVDAGGRPIGIVSRSDLLKAYSRGDSEIREDIVQGVLRDTLWIDPEPLQITVERGVVRLAGQVDRKTTALSVGHMCVLVPGVIEVHNGLTWEMDDTRLAETGYFRSHPFSTDVGSR